MGCFDSVHVNCPDPNCDGRIEFQTKAGACQLDTFTLSNAPLVIVAALDGESDSCDTCDKEVTLRVSCTPRLLVEYPSRRQKEDDDDF